MEEKKQAVRLLVEVDKATAQRLAAEAVGAGGTATDCDAVYGANVTPDEVAYRSRLAEEARDINCEERAFDLGLGAVVNLLTHLYSLSRSAERIAKTLEGLDRAHHAGAKEQ